MTNLVKILLLAITLSIMIAPLTLLSTNTAFAKHDDKGNDMTTTTSQAATTTNTDKPSDIKTDDKNKNSDNNNNNNNDQLQPILPQPQITTTTKENTKTSDTKTDSNNNNQDNGKQTTTFGPGSGSEPKIKIKHDTTTTTTGNNDNNGSSSTTSKPNHNTHVVIVKQHDNNQQQSSSSSSSNTVVVRPIIIHRDITHKTVTIQRVINNQAVIQTVKTIDIPEVNDETSTNVGVELPTVKFQDKATGLFHIIGNVGNGGSSNVNIKKVLATLNDGDDNPLSIIPAAIPPNTEKLAPGQSTSFEIVLTQALFKIKDIDNIVYHVDFEK